MALIFSNAARLKPEIRLAEAVSQFEAALSAEDKVAFRDQRSKVVKTSPDTMDVMYFTAQIDRRLSAKAGRCLGPRFTNFLSSVQQFASLGDVIVGGSQNIIACGVWTVVRMSILAMTKLSSHIEDLSIMFMEVGRSSPRYQELALLYSRSKTLQTYINEYYIAAVHMCCDLMSFTRKSALAQFTSSLNNEATRKTRSDLRRWANEIESEASLLLARRFEVEVAENSQFRLVSSKYSKSISEQQVLARRLRILEECSRYDHETTWKQIRKSGNTSIFAQQDVYKSWKSVTESCTLLYYGRLGCGKSVTMANMVDNLTTEKQNIPVVYFFTRQDIPDSLKSRTVIGSLARQLLQLTDTFTDNCREGEQAFDGFLSVQNIVTLLRQTYAKKNKVYLLLDGLDLCNDSDKAEIIDFVRQLQIDRWLLVCASLRQSSHSSVEPLYQNFLNITTSLLPDNKVDIEDFIEAELTRCLSNDLLKLGNAALIIKIQDALLFGSSGMFLWVVLQIRTLCQMTTDEDIIDALNDLPADLSETYKRILQKERGKQKMYQSLILQFVTAAQQPLIMAELREALSVNAGDTNWTATRMINDIEYTLMSCGCLIQVDEEELTVRFVHPSVRDYLLLFPKALGITGKLSQRRKTSTIGECHSIIADAIMTYLSYGILETQVSTARVPHIPAGAAPARIVESVTTRSSPAQRLALRFLAQRKQPDFDLGKALAQESGNNDLRRREDFVFQHYARKWCLYHVSICDGDDLGRYAALLLPDLLRRHVHVQELAPETAFKMAVDHNNERLLDLLLASSFQASVNSRFDIRHRNQSVNYSLMDFAICKGNRKIVEKLLPYADQPLSPDHCLPNLAICDYIYRGALENMLRPLVNLPEKLTLNLSSKHYMHVCHSGRNILAGAIWGNNKSALNSLLQDDQLSTYLNHMRHYDSQSHINIIEEALWAQDVTILSMLQGLREFSLTQPEKQQLIHLAADLNFPDGMPILRAFTNPAWFSSSGQEMQT